jgi:ankyrin repeat protein
MSGSIELVEYMLSLGVDVNQTDRSGISPLYVGVYTGNISIVKLLLSKKADPWIKGHNSSTVLHICAERNFVEIAKLILEQDVKN